MSGDYHSSSRKSDIIKHINLLSKNYIYGITIEGKATLGEGIKYKEKFVEQLFRKIVIVFKEPLVLLAESRNLALH